MGQQVRNRKTAPNKFFTICEIKLKHFLTYTIDDDDDDDDDQSAANSLNFHK
jgi:hypothetical protein